MHKLLSTTLLFLLLTSSLYYSSTDTVLAFAHSNNKNIHPYHKHQYYRRHILMKTRGGSTAARSTTKLSTATISNYDNDDKTIKSAKQALSAIKYCVKMSFFSVLSNVVITFIDNDIYTKYFKKELSFIEYVNIFDSLSLLLFGMGLWKISSLYHYNMSNMNKRMSHDNLLKLFSSMSWIWGITAVNLALVSVSSVALLPSTIKGGYFQFILDRVTSKQLSYGIIGILCVVTGFIYNNCERTAAREVQAYRTKNNTQVDQYLKNQTTRVKFNKVRASAFNAYFNQAICAGSFGIMASIELLKWILSLSLDSLEGIVGHVFSVTTFITPFTITGLLFTLNKSLLHAAIAEVIGSSDNNDKSSNANDVEIYNDLFVAQTGFYQEAAKTLKDATIFGLLPYLVAPVLPYILKVSGLLKLMERLLPSQLYTQLVTAVGV